MWANFWVLRVVMLGFIALFPTLSLYFFLSHNIHISTAAWWLSQSRSLITNGRDDMTGLRLDYIILECYMRADKFSLMSCSKCTGFPGAGGISEKDLCGVGFLCVCPLISRHFLPKNRDLITPTMSSSHQIAAQSPPNPTNTTRNAYATGGGVGGINLQTPHCTDDVKGQLFTSGPKAMAREATSNNKNTQTTQQSIWMQVGMYRVGKDGV